MFLSLLISQYRKVRVGAIAGGKPHNAIGAACAAVDDGRQTSVASADVVAPYNLSSIKCNLVHIHRAVWNHFGGSIVIAISRIVCAPNKGIIGHAQWCLQSHIRATAHRVNGTEPAI